MTTPFARAWMSFDLGDARPCAGDYEAYPYETLPPIDESLFDGSFEWLRPDDADDDEDEDEDEDDDDADDPQAGRLGTVIQELAGVGAKLPAAFVQFMADEDLQDHVPTCLGCEWDLSPHPIESPFEDDAWLVRFLRDPEGAAYWYLHITPTGTYVVCSTVAFDDPKLNEAPAALAAKTYWCAPHFENFVYRFWIENVLWELLEDGAKLSPTEAAYLKHYTKPGKGPKRAK